MTNKQETIADIVREMWAMRERTSIVLAVRGYAKRIDEAYKRDTERLRRALKPVLECHLCDGGQQVVSDALCAIREAQEIMKGETK